MISVSHAFTGAFIAHCFPAQPLVYLPLSFASHFLLDYVIHYDIGVAAKIYHFSKKKMIAWELLDLLGAVLLITLIFKQSLHNFNLDLYLGALSGITPDLLQATDYVLKRPLKILAPFYAFHHRFHRSTKNAFWGLLPQAILLITLGLLVTFKQ